MIFTIAGLCFYKFSHPVLLGIDQFHLLPPGEHLADVFLEKLRYPCSQRKSQLHLMEKEIAYLHVCKSKTKNKNMRKMAELLQNDKFQNEIQQHLTILIWKRLGGF